MALNTNLNNKEMIDYAKNEMVNIMKTYVGQVSVEAGKALALLIMAENETKLQNNVVREVLD